MQHRYVPDLGDFSKFAVIDALSGQGTLRTALIWYLVDPDEVGDSHKNDGKHTGYLSNDSQGLAACHPALYKRFLAIDGGGHKHVDVYRRHRVVPGVSYFAEGLSYDGRALSDRLPWREGWLERAIGVASKADIVMLDPDNGLMADRLSIRSRQAVKYASLDECAAFYGGGRRTLVVYQHAHRQGSVAEQTDRALRRLAGRLGVDRGQTFALRFHRGTSRCYLIAPATDHRQAMRQQACAMIRGLWGQRGHFSIVD